VNLYSDIQLWCAERFCTSCTVRYVDRRTDPHAFTEWTGQWVRREWSLSRVYVVFVVSSLKPQAMRCVVLCYAAGIDVIRGEPIAECLGWWVSNRCRWCCAGYPVRGNNRHGREMGI